MIMISPPKKLAAAAILIGVVGLFAPFTIVPGLWIPFGFLYLVALSGHVDVLPGILFDLPAIIFFLTVFTPAIYQPGPRGPWRLAGLVPAAILPLVWLAFIPIARYRTLDMGWGCYLHAAAFTLMSAAWIWRSALADGAPSSRGFEVLPPKLQSENESEEWIQY